ncbi:MAG TPA: hypothetical protein VMV18_15205, partial [bacterium]|nr:hypothetical protein [bacterium]
NLPRVAGVLGILVLAVIAVLANGWGTSHGVPFERSYVADRPLQTIGPIRVVSFVRKNQWGGVVLVDSGWYHASQDQRAQAARMFFGRPEFRGVRWIAINDYSGRVLATLTSSGTFSQSPVALSSTP